jgi:uncharacterized iron-regulated protein
MQRRRAPWLWTAALTAGLGAFSCAAGDVLAAPGRNDPGSPMHAAATAPAPSFAPAAAARPATAASATSATPATPATPAAAATTPPAPLRLERPIVLLGEVHDHPQQHALRAEAFAALLAGGARPALVMEQFDRERQAELDALRAAQPALDADTLIARIGGPGWHWPFYRPFVDMALQHGLPIVAANVSRDEARAVMREGLAARGFDPGVPEAVLAGLAALVEDGHCGQVGAALARRMALAQVARDQAMARALEAHAQRGAVLLAGNGHVRTDVGVPVWLTPATRARSQAIGVVEDGDPTLAFDQRVLTQPHSRPDPCAAFRAPAAAPLRTP